MTSGDDDRNLLAEMLAERLDRAEAKLASWEAHLRHCPFARLEELTPLEHIDASRGGRG